MKNLSILFVAAMSLTAVAGCKKKGGGADCASAISGAMDRTMDDGMKAMKDMPADQKKMAEDMAKTMMPKMKDAMTKACTDDKWSDDAIKCLNDGKTQADMQTCEGKLTPEQKANMEKAMASAMGMGDMKGGDMHGSAAAGSDMGSAAMAGSGSAAPTMAGSGSAMGSDMGSGSAAPAMAGSGSAAPAMAGSGSDMGSGSAAK